MAQQENSNGFPSYAWNQFAFDGFFRYQTHGPAGATFRRATAYHCNQTLFLAIVEHFGCTRPLLFVQRPLQPALLASVITDFGAGLAAGLTVVPPDPPPGRSPSASACWPYREATELGLSRGRNAMAIWQDLVDTCSFAAGYQSVRRFVSKLHPSPSREACAVIETVPGEEAQVDYGIFRPLVWHELAKPRNLSRAECFNFF